MKNISIFQILLLAGFGALAVAGVLIFSFAIGGGTTNTIGAVKIWGTLDQAAMTAVIRQAADTDPSLAMVSYEQKDPATYEKDLTEALANGTAPDLFVLRQDFAFKDIGKLALSPLSTLSQAQFESTFIQAAEPFVSQAGILGIPILSDPIVLYWNKDMFAAAGFSEAPRYWDQIFAMSQKLTVKDSTGAITKSAIALGEYQNIPAAKEILAALIMQAGGYITGRDSSGRLVSELLPKSGGGGAQSTETALRFYTEFADPSKIDYSWNRSLPQAREAFASGDLALYIGYASENTLITRANPNLNFAEAALPQIRAGKSTMTTARVYALSATRSGRNPAGALTAAYTLAKLENAQALSVALGLPSARRDALSVAATTAVPQGLVSQNDTCRGLDIPICSSAMARAWIDPDPDATATIFRAMIENTTSGASLVTEAVQRADQQLSNLLSQ